MPGWYEKLKSELDRGDIQAIGLIQEQHPRRTELFNQWKELEMTMLVDPLNTLDVSAVRSATPSTATTKGFVGVVLRARAESTDMAKKRMHVVWRRVLRVLRVVAVALDVAAAASTAGRSL